jgi:hypothetical protein
MTVNSEHLIVDRDFLLNLEPAPQTKTYGGVDHHKVYDLAKEIAVGAGLNFIKDRIEVTKQGKRAYMQLHFENFLPGFSEFTYTVGIRSTYDKSASLAFASGPAVFICSNQQIHGEDVTVHRKHSKYIMNDIGDLMEQVVASGKERYESRINHLNAMRSTDLTTKQGQLIIGCARGLGLLGSKTTKSAMDHWMQPPFEEFRGENNMFGLHNALTWAAHTERPSRKLEFHKSMNEFMDTVKVVDEKLVIG